MSLILGIDPGSRITGYGLIREEEKMLHYVDSGCIRTQAQTSLSARLLVIFQGICELLDVYQPREMAIERVFVYQNVASALILGHARGAAMVAAASHKLAIAEYAPREIKEAVVGYGAAEKKQVAHMVVHLLRLPRAPQSDAADALAIAICHSYKKPKVITR